jgi:Flp pilus assembly protein TadD, contains TPR repeats
MLGNKRNTIIILVGILCVLLMGCKEEGPTIVELLESGEYETAISKLEIMIEREDNVGEAYRGLGIAYWELEEYQKARGAFEYALASGEEETGIICNFIAVCDLRLGHIESARQWFERGLAKENNAPELIREMEFNQIAVYQKQGDFETAKEKLAIYVEKYPDDIEARKEADFLETR